MSNQIASYVTPIIVMAIVLWRLSRQQTGRRVKPSWLWIRPAIVGLFLVAILATSPRPDTLGLAICAAAAAAGLGVGYLLTRHQALSLDPESGRITSRMSPVGIALFGVLFATRYVFRLIFTDGQAADMMAAHSAKIMLYTDAALLFAFALVSAQAWEIWRRARTLLAEHAARQDAAAGE